MEGRYIVKPKVLMLLWIGLAYVSGILTSISIYILLIRRIVSSVRKMAALAKTGTRVNATVTRIKTLKTSTPVTFEFPGGMKRNTNAAPQTIYRLYARWQHPETGKKYTLKGMITNSAAYSAYPVGSSIPFLVDYTHPQTHLIANAIPESMQSDSSL